MALDQRQTDILLTIVKNYILTGQPVGSRTVAKDSSLSLSPASIRNIMADLTDAGYIEQPHTSAGRIPTAHGLRYYLDSNLEVEPVSPEVREKIKSSLTSVGPDLSQTLSQTCKILSSLSNQISLVITPDHQAIRWQRIDFVLLRPGLIMSILVMEGGLIRNKVISVDKEISADDLVKFGNYLNEHYQGKTLHYVRSSVLAQMKNARIQFEGLYEKALKLAHESFDDSGRQVYMEGTHYVFQGSDSADINKMRELFRMLEEKSKLLKLLDKTIESKNISVILGQEEKWDELSDFTVISSPYSLGGSNIGAVSIIGPTRMNYSKIIPAVDLTAKILSQLLREIYENKAGQNLPG
ncbi:heat-inducible transcriptional repressor HrcA [Desulfonatronovibrio hydrogenovorans]|uniref:heat-inducible transcriptional repressor HrcA n=1 Tax=Desulfonatronovibrio hydrogenovorans TaxID=53245 RepID=UPI0004903A92|nr:heat-inducible transcriptional repressor HrcA [Desulfonatronovibrio hydrogenovorans]